MDASTHNEPEGTRALPAGGATHQPGETPIEVGSRWVRRATATRVIVEEVRGDGAVWARRINASGQVVGREKGTYFVADMSPEMFRKLHRPERDGESLVAPGGVGEAVGA